MKGLYIFVSSDKFEIVCFMDDVQRFCFHNFAKLQYLFQNSLYYYSVWASYTEPQK